MFATVFYVGKCSKFIKIFSDCDNNEIYQITREIFQTFANE